MSIFYSKNGKIRYKSLAFLGYPNYLVGNNGTVWSRQKINGKMKWVKKAVSFYAKTGYAKITLSHEGKKRTFLVHRLVLLAFVGPPPAGMQSCHNNNQRTDNKLSNLRWDTRSNNNLDKNEHGTMAKGDKHYRAKLTAEKVREIIKLRSILNPKKLRGHEYSFYKLADMYGVCYQAIQRIFNGACWKDIMAEESDKKSD